MFALTPIVSLLSIFYLRSVYRLLITQCVVRTTVLILKVDGIYPCRTVPNAPNRRILNLLYILSQSSWSRTRGGA